jgi:hypothetical protein
MARSSSDTDTPGARPSLPAASASAGLPAPQSAGRQAIVAAARDRLRVTVAARPVRIALKAAAVVVLAGAAAVTIESVPGILASIGIDFRVYQGYTTSWLHGGPLYAPAQLAGPYSIEDLNGNAYPPTLLWLTAPFALGLPAVLWWAVPLGVIAASLARVRPSRAGWLLLACLLVYPRTWYALLLGNPALWAYAAIAAGAAWGWPAALAAIKLPLAPFALPGWRRRDWRAAVLGLVALSLPFGVLWVQYGEALLNARSGRGLSYTLGDWPVAAVLLVATRYLGSGAPASTEIPTSAGGAATAVTVTTRSAEYVCDMSSTWSVVEPAARAVTK